MSVDPSIFQAITIATGLKLYARTGMKPNRAWTPKAMMAAAARLTGKRFAARDYIGAAEALTAHAKALAEAQDMKGTLLDIHA